jgi:hypothetical protein
MVSCPDGKDIHPTQMQENAVLANVSDYLAIWQLPVMAIVLFGWLVGGGYLFQRTLSKATDNRRFKFAKGVQVSLLAGLAGVFSAFIMYLVGNNLILPGEADMPVSIPGVILAVIALLVMSVLTVWAMFPLSFGQTARACALPIGSVFLLILVAGTGVGIPTYYTREANIRQADNINATIGQVNRIYLAMIRNGRDQPPASLQELVKLEYIEPETLISPANPDGPGFFYHQPDVIEPPSPDSQKVLMCDFRDNFNGKGRTVLYHNSVIHFLPETSFQSLMMDPVNREFAKALQKAESQ